MCESEIFLFKINITSKRKMSTKRIQPEVHEYLEMTRIEREDSKIKDFFFPVFLGGYGQMCLAEKNHLE